MSKTLIWGYQFCWKNNQKQLSLRFHFISIGSFPEINVFLKILQNSNFTTLLKKRLWHRCFPVSFANFSRTHFFAEHFWTTASVNFIWFFNLLEKEPSEKLCGMKLKSFEFSASDAIPANVINLSPIFVHIFLNFIKRETYTSFMTFWSIFTNLWG